MCWPTAFSGSSLLWVAALGLIVIYNYAVVTFVFMPNDFNNQDEGEVVRYCGTLFECFITVLEYGLLDTIGAVSHMHSHSITKYMWYIHAHLDCWFTKKSKRCYLKSTFLWSVLFHHRDNHWSEYCVWHHCGCILSIKRWKGKYFINVYTCIYV